MVLADKTAQLERQLVASANQGQGSTTTTIGSQELEDELKRAKETMKQMKESLNEVDQMKARMFQLLYAHTVG